MSAPWPHSVVLIGNYLPDRQESMLRFATVLEKELHQLGIEANIVRPAEILGRLKTGLGILDKWIGYFDKFVLFPFTLRRVARTAAPGTLFHICDHSNSMYGIHLQGRWLITCHDLLAIQSALGEIPENPTGWSGRILQSWILSRLCKARHIACDSQHTADQVRRLTSLPGDQMKVIRLGLNESFEPLSEETRGNILNPLFSSRGLTRPRRYLLHVGGNQWYKNRAGLIEIFSRVASSVEDIHLVFAGKSLPLELIALANEKKLGDRILNLEEVSHDQLNALYSGAEALVFPSLVEGFGWPPVEAQASGCPVIVSDRAPLNEITNDSAVLIDPIAVDPAAATIVEFLAWTPGKRNELISHGLANSAYFATRRMMQEYVEYYAEIVSRPH